MEVTEIHNGWLYYLEGQDWQQNLYVLYNNRTLHVYEHMKAKQLKQPKDIIRLINISRIHRLTTNHTTQFSDPILLTSSTSLPLTNNYSNTSVSTVTTTTTTTTTTTDNNDNDNNNNNNNNNNMITIIDTVIDDYRNNNNNNNNNNKKIHRPPPPPSSSSPSSSSSSSSTSPSQSPSPSPPPPKKPTSPLRRPQPRSYHHTNAHSDRLIMARPINTAAAVSVAMAINNHNHSHNHNHNTTTTTNNTIESEENTLSVFGRQKVQTNYRTYSDFGTNHDGVSNASIKLPRLATAQKLRIDDQTIKPKLPPPPPPLSQSQSQSQIFSSIQTSFNSSKKEQDPLHNYQSPYARVSLSEMDNHNILSALDETPGYDHNEQDPDVSMMITDQENEDRLFSITDINYRLKKNHNNDDDDSDDNDNREEVLVTSEDEEEYTNNVEGGEKPEKKEHNNQVPNKKRRKLSTSFAEEKKRKVPLRPRPPPKSKFSKTPPPRIAKSQSSVLLKMQTPGPEVKKTTDLSKIELESNTTHVKSDSSGTIPYPKLCMFEVKQPWRTHIFGCDTVEVMHEWMRWLRHYATAKVIFSGWLTKQGGRIKTIKRRYFLLYDTLLLYYYKDERSADAPLGQIDLGKVLYVTAKRDRVGSMSNIIELKTPERLWMLAAETDQERKTWLTVLEHAIGNRKKIIWLKEGSLMYESKLHGWNAIYLVLCRSRLFAFKHQGRWKRIQAMRFFNSQAIEDAFNKYSDKYILLDADAKIHKLIKYKDYDNVLELVSGNKTWRLASIKSPKQDTPDIDEWNATLLRMQFLLMKSHNKEALLAKDATANSSEKSNKDISLKQQTATPSDIMERIAEDTKVEWADLFYETVEDKIVYQIKSMMLGSENHDTKNMAEELEYSVVKIGPSKTDSEYSDDGISITSSLPLFQSRSSIVDIPELTVLHGEKNSYPEETTDKNKDQQRNSIPSAEKEREKLAKLQTIKKYHDHFFESFDQWCKSKEILWIIREYLDAAIAFIFETQGEYLRNLMIEADQDDIEVEDEEDEKTGNTRSKSTVDVPSMSKVVNLQLRPLIERAVVESVLASKARAILKVVERRTRRKYQLLLQKLAKLIGKSQSEFGIPADDQSSTDWCSAVKQLQTLKKCHLPLEMIQCLVLTASAIHNDKNINQPIDADHFMNIAIYVYVKASTVKLPAITEAELLFMEGLIDKQTAMSEGGYYFTVFRAVVNWIYQYDEKKKG